MSRVAVDSASASAACGTIRTWVAEVSPNTPPLSSSATRWPRLASVASRMRMRATSADASERFAMYAGRNISAPKKTGPKIVATRNHLVRTRSMYSRSSTTSSFFMSVCEFDGVAQEGATERNLVPVVGKRLRVVQRTLGKHFNVVGRERRRGNVLFHGRVHGPRDGRDTSQYHPHRAVLAPDDGNRGQRKVPRAALEHFRVT